MDPDDEAALLATIEDAADRLDALIGNLLDMSLATGRWRRSCSPRRSRRPGRLAGAGPGEQHPDGRADGPPPRAPTRANWRWPFPWPGSSRAAGRAARDEVLIEVWTTARAFRTSLKARMFEPFERLGERGWIGVGLGLAVARGFLEVMGGTVLAADTPGGGLTVRVGLPVAAAPAVRPR